MTITTSTLRPGFLVSLKTSLRGNVHYERTDIADEGAVQEWNTKRTIEDPEEHDRAKKARAKASAAVRRVCSLSEIRELLAEMSTGVENGNTDAIREAASRVKGIGEMLSTEAQTKVEMAVKTARDAAKAIVRERDREGTQGTVFVDKSAIKRINELRTAFLDLDDNEAEVAAPKISAAATLDLAS
jgi:hypothetical protein